MPIDYGQTYAQGVKYLKINRYDSGGLDQSGYLGQLTNLTINYNDLGPIQYNIVTTQEQDTYFVYGIQTRNQSTSSINYDILSSSIGIQNATPFTTILDDKTTVGVDVGGYTVLSGNASLLGSFGSYLVPRTPNVQLFLTISASYTNSSGFTSNARLFYGTYNDDISQTSIIDTNGSPTAISNGSSGILAFTWSNFSSNILENDLFNSYVFGIITNDSTLNITNFKVIVSQSQAPNFDYPILTIFNPEFIDWDYNDYNALFGNAEEPQFSTQLMDVDYTSTFTTPVNFNLIISGTADRAQVQDSNYSSQAWSNIRYNGVKSNSPGFNQLTTDGGYGALPNVEQNKTYIAHFDAVGGTGPEIIGQTAYFIKYLIDENGNVINPEPDTIALYNLLDSYEPGKNALVRLISGDPAQSSNPNDDSLTGLHPITHVGRISPILMSETGSKFADTASILYFDDFAQYSTISTPEYGFRAVTTTSVTVPYADPEYTIICDLETLASSFYNNSDGIYTFTSNTYTYNNRVKFTANGTIIGTFNTEAPIGSTFILTVRIKNNLNILTYQDLLFTKTNALNLSYRQDFNLKIPLQSFSNTDQVKLTFDGVASSGISDISSPILLSGIEFKAQNEYPANSITASAPYWTVGSYLTGSNVSVLTSSLELVNIYGSSFYQSQSQAMLTWGFSPISLAFQPQVGDFIRIEYNPDKVFNITKVEATDRLYLTVVPPIPSGSFLNHFCLYRIINDGTYVILDVNKIQTGSSFTGIIQPEYISQTLKDNYSNIIQNLTQKGLIS
jgi:hypothetical protein